MPFRREPNFLPKITSKTLKMEIPNHLQTKFYTNNIPTRKLPMQLILWTRPRLFKDAPHFVWFCDSDSLYDAQLLEEPLVGHQMSCRNTSSLQQLQ